MQREPRKLAVAEDVSMPRNRRGDVDEGGLEGQKGHAWPGLAGSQASGTTPRAGSRRLRSWVTTQLTPA